MAHRERRTAQDPDVEASQAELAAIESAKHTAQNAVLSVAQNKKQLEADFEAAKKKLDEELTLKRQEYAAEIKKMEESKSAVEAHLTEISDTQGKAMAYTKQLEATRDAIQKEVTEANEKRSAANTEVTRLMVLQHDLNESIKDSRSDYKTAEEKVAAKTKEIAELTRKLTEVRNTHDAVVGYTTEQRTKHEALTSSVEALSKAEKELSERIVTKTEQKTTLDAELLETQKKIAEHKQEMATRDAESTTRAGNAARLEQHVDKKLAHLKELESHFTTEHLARVGYKKT